MRKLVLIVDDEFGLADIVAEILSEAGYDVEVAINGLMALERIATRRPDVCLVDVMMPILDGPELLRRMRADAEMAAIPVILMTAMPQAIPPDVLPMIQKLLIKPFHPRALFEALGRCLGED